MKNIFKLIVDAEELSDEDAMSLFDCDKKTLKQILSGNKTPDLNGVYNINKKYEISLELMIKGKESNSKDEKIIKTLESKISSHKKDLLFNDFVKGIKKNGFSLSEEQICKIYNAKDDCIYVDNLIEINDYKLYTFVKSLNKTVLKGQIGFSPRTINWNEADKIVLNLFIEDKLMFWGEIVQTLDFSTLSNEEINGLFKKYQYGQLPFDPQKILKLIELGARITRVENVTYSSANENINLITQGDSFTMILLKQYCENLIKNKKE